MKETTTTTEYRGKEDVTEAEEAHIAALFASAKNEALPSREKLAQALEETKAKDCYSLRSCLSSFRFWISKNFYQDEAHS